MSDAAHGSEAAPTYVGELARQWRPLLAAFLGLGSGFSTSGYVVSIMAPRMIAEFGWSKASFAMIGSLALTSVPFFPVVGRLADRIGVRRTALIGIVVMPIVYLALSRMTGDIRVYMVLYVVQAVLCLTTTATVYTRTVVRHVAQARGLALAIAASAPAVFGALGGPLLNNFVAANGWRAGYQVMAVYALIAGIAAVLLLPGKRTLSGTARIVSASASSFKEAMTRNPAFWILAASMLLCNFQQVIALTQLNLILIDDGVALLAVSGMISALAVGTLLGRFVCGLALDRFPARIVAALGMALTSVGLFLLASPLNIWSVQFASVLLIGMSIGAEGDLLGYLVVHYFGIARYSSVMGVLTALISITAAAGAIILGLFLRGHGSYSAFLSLCGVAVLLGSAILLFLPKNPNCNATYQPIA